MEILNLLLSLFSILYQTQIIEQNSECHVKNFNELKSILHKKQICKIIIKNEIVVDQNIKIPDKNIIEFRGLGKLILENNIIILSDIVAPYHKHIIEVKKGTLHGKNTQTIYPGWFGAKGNGRSNDTKPFNDAGKFLTYTLDSKGRVTGGGILKIPYGKYIVGKQIEIPCVKSGSLCRVQKPSPILWISNAYAPIVIEGIPDKQNRLPVFKIEKGLKAGVFSFKVKDKNVFKDSKVIAYSGIILLSDIKDALIKNIELDGNVNQLNIGKSGQSRYQTTMHGIISHGSQKLNVFNVYSHHHLGDGMYLGFFKNTTNRRKSKDKTLVSRSEYIKEYFSKNNPQKIIISKFNSQFNGRQGLTINCLSNITISNSSFSNTGRIKYFSPPSAGIDIECHTCLGLTNSVKIKNTVFHNNLGHGIVNDSFKGKCTEKGNHHKSSETITNFGFVNFAENIEIDNCIFTGSGRYFIFIKSPSLKIKNSIFISHKGKSAIQYMFSNLWKTGECSTIKGDYGCRNINDSPQILGSIIYHRNDSPSYIFDQASGFIKNTVIISKGNPIIWSNGKTAFQNIPVLFTNKCKKNLSFVNRANSSMIFQNIRGFYTGEDPPDCKIANGKYDYNCFRTSFTRQYLPTTCKNIHEYSGSFFESKIINNSINLLKKNSTKIVKKDFYELLQILENWPQPTWTDLTIEQAYGRGNVRVTNSVLNNNQKNSILTFTNSNKKIIWQTKVHHSQGLFLKKGKLVLISYIKPLNTAHFSVYSSFDLKTGKKISQVSSFLPKDSIFIKAQIDETGSVSFLMKKQGKLIRVNVEN